MEKKKQFNDMVAMDYSWLIRIYSDHYSHPMINHD